MLKKRLRIITLVNKRNTRYLKKTHKFGVELPMSVAQIYAQDKKNGNNLWEDTIFNYMKDFSPALRKLDNGDIGPIGYQHVNYHMIFDVKMEYFRLEARLVPGGHVTYLPVTITYVSAVTMETVSIALLLTALNDFPVQVADITNSYTTAPVTENV